VDEVETNINNLSATRLQLIQKRILYENSYMLMVKNSAKKFLTFFKKTIAIRKKM